MFENGPSPLAQIVLTLIIGGHMGVEDTPNMVKEEVEYFYPLILGKPIEENIQE